MNQVSTFLYVGLVSEPITVVVAGFFYYYFFFIVCVCVCVCVLIINVFNVIFV